MNIKLHIERVVLEGLSLEAQGGVSLQASLEWELAAQLSQYGLHEEWQSRKSVPHIRVPGIAIDPSANPRTLGRAIGQSVYGAIGNPISLRREGPVPK